MSAQHEPQSRKRVITIRHETPSRRRIALLVVQSQNQLGEWMVPIITFEGGMETMLESGRYARDLGIGLIVAAWTFEEMMQRVKNREFDGNERTDLSIQDG